MRPAVLPLIKDEYFPGKPLPEKKGSPTCTACALPGEEGVKSLQKEADKPLFAGLFARMLSYYKGNKGASQPCLTCPSETLTIHLYI